MVKKFIHNKGGEKSYHMGAYSQNKRLGNKKKEKKVKFSGELRFLLPEYWNETLKIDFLQEEFWANGMIDHMASWAYKKYSKYRNKRTSSSRTFL